MNAEHGSRASVPPGEAHSSLPVHRSSFLVHRWTSSFIVPSKQTPLLPQLPRQHHPLPDLADPMTAPYFTAAAAGELRVPRCADCGRFVWYPADACPACGATVLPWTRVSGQGTLFSWAVVRRAFLPAFADRVPFVTGLVAIVEDPAVRLVTYVVDSDPETLAPDQAGTRRDIDQGAPGASSTSIRTRPSHG